MEDLSAKVFRTYNASITLCQELYKGEINADNDTLDAKLKYYEDCNRKVALLCNHQRAVPKSHEASMEKAYEKINEKKEQIKMI